MASPMRMKHPRWRWIFAAGQVGQRPPSNDGLGTAYAPDNSIKMLVRAYEGKTKIKAQHKAIEYFQVDSGRQLLDSLLISTGSVAETASYMSLPTDVVQWYADWFFDITVFEGPGDKMLYIDRVSLREPTEADLLRRALSFTNENWKTFLKPEDAEKWNSQRFLMTNLNIVGNLTAAFAPKDLELGLEVGDLEKQKIRLDLYKTFLNQGLKIVEILGKLELDKTKEDFLEHFIMKLKDPDPHTMIQLEKPKELL